MLHGSLSATHQCLSTVFKVGQPASIHDPFDKNRSEHDFDLVAALRWFARSIPSFSYNQGKQHLTTHCKAIASVEREHAATVKEVPTNRSRVRSDVVDSERNEFIHRNIVVVITAGRNVDN